MSKNKYMLTAKEANKIATEFIQAKIVEHTQNAQRDLPAIISYIEKVVTEKANEGIKSVSIMITDIDKQGLCFYNSFPEVKEHFTALGYNTEYCGQVNPNFNHITISWYNAQ